MSMIADFSQIISKGGPMMVVIFVTACIAISMLIWQFLQSLSLSRQAKRDYQRLQKNENYSPDPNSTSPIAQIHKLINWQEITSKDELEKQLNISLVEIFPKLEGALPTIATLASLLPMLGLLGTVTGMINVFEVIAVQGSGQPKEMADGISQALLTTASGLMFAIPVIFLHHLLAQKTTRLLSITRRAMLIILHRKSETTQAV